MSINNLIKWTSLFVEIIGIRMLSSIMTIDYWYPSSVEWLILPIMRAQAKLHLRVQLVGARIVLYIYNNSANFLNKYCFYTVVNISIVDLEIHWWSLPNQSRWLILPWSFMMICLSIKLSSLMYSMNWQICKLKLNWEAALKII